MARTREGHAAADAIMNEAVGRASSAYEGEDYVVMVGRYLVVAETFDDEGEMHMTILWTQDARSWQLLGLTRAVENYVATLDARKVIEGQGEGDE